MEISLSDLKQILCEVKGGPSIKQVESVLPYKIGANYFIRTVTHHYTGKLVAVYPQELVIVDAAWIADDGRFTAAVASGSFSEIEPWPDGVEVIIPRGSVLDASTITFQLPRGQK